MKKIITLLILLFSTNISAEENISLSPENIMSIIKGKDTETQERLLKEVLKNSSNIGALGLMLTASTAYQAEKKEEAAFLFYAGQIRGASDMKSYVPKGKGGNSPATLLGSLSFQLGSVINTEIMREPVLYANVVKRLKSWQPQYSATYDPGWEYENKPNIKEAATIISNLKSQRIGPMSDISLLLNDKEYFESFLTMQDYNMGAFKYRDDESMKIKKEKAEQKMESIEKAKNIKGFISLTKNR